MRAKNLPAELRVCQESCYCCRGSLVHKPSCTCILHSARRQSNRIHVYAQPCMRLHLPFSAGAAFNILKNHIRVLRAGVCSVEKGYWIARSPAQHCFEQMVKTEQSIRYPYSGREGTRSLLQGLARLLWQNPHRLLGALLQHCYAASCM